MKKVCWCGRKRAFRYCCEPYLTGNAITPTAEALMRSRYSAFCAQAIDYLIGTNHPSTRNDRDRATLVHTCQTTRWVNLIILNVNKGTTADKTGIVEFVAAYQSGLDMSSLPTGGEKKGLKQLHERSRFIKESGQWFYTDGDILPAHQPKPNQVCWCGSQKRYRYCHG